MTANPLRELDALNPEPVEGPNSVTLFTRRPLIDCLELAADQFQVSEGCEPGHGFVKLLALEVAVVNSSFHFAPHQAGLLEDLEVLGDGRRRDGKGFGQFANGCWAIRESLEDSATGGIREC